MKKYRSNVKYTNNISVSGGIKMVHYKTSRVVRNRSSRYHNCQHLLIGLSKCAEMFLRYSTEIMDKENRFTNTVLQRQKFIKHMKKDCATVYKDKTVQSAVDEIKAVGLYLKLGKRGMFTVNPLYYYNGAEKHRVQLVADLMKEAKTKPIHKDANVVKALVIPVESA